MSYPSKADLDRIEFLAKEIERGEPYTLDDPGGSLRRDIQKMELELAKLRLKVAQVRATKNLLDLSSDERSLLLFLETRAVDHSGRVQTARMNADDVDIAAKWNAEGFVAFGRIRAVDCNEYGTHWCRLSDRAWALAHEERKTRAARTWDKRGWKTTKEAR